MYARVVIAQIQSGRMDEVVNIYRDSLMPTAKQAKGFKGASLLTSLVTGNVISVSLWETEDDMMAQAASGDFHLQLAEAAHTFVGPASMEHYEVSVQA